MMTGYETVYNDDRLYFYEYTVSNDDMTTKKYLTHPEKKSTGKMNIGRRLPKEIPIPKWFADPTHRAKCVAGKFFNYNKASNKMTKLDCLRLKKYYSYYIKTNRQKSVEAIMDHIMVPLDHLFDDHKHCDSRWCHKKRREEDLNSVIKLALSGTRRITTDARQMMLSYMLNYVNCTSYISQKNASHSTSTSLKHMSMKV